MLYSPVMTTQCLIGGGINQDVSQLTHDVSDLKSGQARLETKTDALGRKVDAIFDQPADLMEFKTEITQKVDNLLAVTKENTSDITRLKAVH